MKEGARVDGTESDRQRGASGDRKTNKQRFWSVPGRTPNSTGGELSGDHRDQEPSYSTRRKTQQAPLKNQRRLQTLPWTTLKTQTWRLGGLLAPRQG